MSLKRPVNNFECIKNTSKFNEHMKMYNEKIDERYFLKISMKAIVVYQFYLKEWKLKK